MTNKKKLRKPHPMVFDDRKIVSVSPAAKTAIQIVVMLIDLFIMFWLIFAALTCFVPKGSWINIVSGDSMDPTMRGGQIIFTDMSQIDRGDIVTAYIPESTVSQHQEYDDMVIVKRVIAVPGDIVLIDETGVYVNDQLVIEEYLTDEAKSATYSPKRYNSLLLGDGEYFLMGDNREVSYDSRSFGAVSHKEILYKQSATPNSNFYSKLMLIVIVFAVDIFVYLLIESALTNYAYKIVSKKKKENVGETVELND